MLLNIDDSITKGSYHSQFCFLFPPPVPCAMFLTHLPLLATWPPASDKIPVSWLQMATFHTVNWTSCGS